MINPHSIHETAPAHQPYPPSPIPYPLIACLLLIPAALLRAAEPAVTPEQEAFFEKQIRPILVAKCLECHGPLQQKAGLRLDSQQALLAGNDSGPALVPGKPAESRMIEVVAWSGDVKMPPKEKLSDTEIASLTEWIKQGAPFPAGTAPAPIPPGSPEGVAQAKATHWAYQPFRHHEPPAVKTAGWAKSSIDRFILAKLESNNIAPGPSAERSVLLRRVTFDLTGLPPTWEELQNFLADADPLAFDKVVDRLLASPRYGERWGRHWLDVARYADTKGYVFTEERKYPFSYTYRDYVINALNDDKPFDAFVTEQLAADQLPLGADKSPLAAMGFLTVGRRFGNNVNDIIDDRIDVVGRGLLGLTIACGRCHDHKFDPIPTDDYYSLYGVFSASAEPGELPLIGPPEESAAYHVFEKELAAREQKVEQFKQKKHDELLDEFRAKTGDYLLAVLKKDKSRSLPAGIGVSLGRGEVRSALVDRWQAFLKETSREHHPLFAPWHAFATLPADQFEEQAKALVAEFAKAPADGPTRINPRVREAFAKSPPKNMAEVAQTYGKLLAETHLAWTQIRTQQPAPSALPDKDAEELRQVLYAEKTPTAFNRDESEKLLDRAARNGLRDLKNKVETFKVTSPVAPPRAMVMHDVPNAGLPHVLVRGNPGRPGKQVPRRFLQVLSRPEDKFSQGSGRLELARAIVSPDNPLTARVIVNRVWTQHFGFGLVRTPSDFGARGDPPSHPELLDDLARTFIDDGWSLKKLHRRILLSQVYRQASDFRPDAAAVDPENRLLWRFAPRRLEFEPLRDSLLFVAGRLDATAGGRPVDLFSQPFSTRRTVYGFIDRQDLPGLLRSFDFASPDVSTPQRPQTTIPQQALFALNSPFVIEQAQRLSARPEVQTAGTPSARIEWLYKLALNRLPAPEEAVAASQFLESAQSQSLTVNGPWQYGYGAVDDKTNRVEKFTPLPAFAEGSWRGGPVLPDPKLGYVMLNATGGHPGAPGISAIRRFTVPESGTLSLTATLANSTQEGDGVRARLISSRQGLLGTWTSKKNRVETSLENLQVEQGETLDFVVDCLTNEAYDSFTWSPTLALNTHPHSAQADFTPPPTSPLTPLEQLAQALLASNEFLFVD